jgi:uncharacterized protein YjdB
VTNASNQSVNWSVSPAIGNITQEGVYSEPAHLTAGQTVSIIATSQADPHQSGSFSLNLSATEPAVSVVIRPHPSSLEAGQNFEFSAIVTGIPNKSVTWSASGAGNAVMWPNGTLYAPANVPANGLTVGIRATSNADPHAHGDTTIRLLPAPPYTGPKSGVVTWTGQLKRNQTLLIDHNKPNTGSITGAFPGVGIVITVQTPGCAVTMQPSQSNGWTSISVLAQARQKSISIAWHVI